jgi:hypothetical protein
LGKLLYSRVEYPLLIIVVHNVDWVQGLEVPTAYHTLVDAIWARWSFLIHLKGGPGLGLVGMGCERAL